MTVFNGVLFVMIWIVLLAWTLMEMLNSQLMQTACMNSKITIP